MESDIRYYRRRANEELAAAGRAVTPAARERRMQLAGLFLQRLKDLEQSRPGAAPALHAAELACIGDAAERSVFGWAEAS